MNISTALRRVKKLKGDLAELLERAKTGVSYKQNDPPAFKFDECIAKAKTTRKELVTLQARIAKTNAVNMISFQGENITLGHAVLLLKEFKGQLAWYSELKGIVRNQPVTSQDETQYDYETEKRVTRVVHYNCALPEAKRAEAAEAIKADFDELNNIVEDMNHRVDLKD